MFKGGSRKDGIILSLPYMTKKVVSRSSKKVKPKTINLASGLYQEKPLAFIVYPYDDSDHDFMLFYEERDAWDYAKEQEEEADVPYGSWEVYALWASDWPIEGKKEIRKKRE